MGRLAIVFLFLLLPFTLSAQDRQAKEKRPEPENREFGFATSGLPIVKSGYDLEKQVAFGKAVIKNGGLLTAFKSIKL
jgi:hypothetical protein